MAAVREEHIIAVSYWICGSRALFQQLAVTAVFRLPAFDGPTPSSCVSEPTGRCCSGAGVGSRAQRPSKMTPRGVDGAEAGNTREFLSPCGGRENARQHGRGSSSIPGFSNRRGAAASPRTGSKQRKTENTRLRWQARKSLNDPDVNNPSKTAEGQRTFPTSGFFTIRFCTCRTTCAAPCASSSVDRVAGCAATPKQRSGLYFGTKITDDYRWPSGDNRSSMLE